MGLEYVFFKGMAVRTGMFGKKFKSDLVYTFGLGMKYNIFGLDFAMKKYKILTENVFEWMSSFTLLIS
jgi:hypothetical protein